MTITVRYFGQKVEGAMAVPMWKPVVGETVQGETLQAGEWCLWRGHHYVGLGDGVLAGPVGSLAVQLPAGELVQRVRLCDENGNQL